MDIDRVCSAQENDGLLMQADAAEKMPASSTGRKKIAMWVFLSMVAIAGVLFCAFHGGLVPGLAIQKADLESIADKARKKAVCDTSAGSCDGKYHNGKKCGYDIHCECMTVGVNSCEPPRDKKKRCNRDVECKSGACDTRGINKCTEPHTIDEGKRCGSDGQCKKPYICNQVGVNSCGSRRGEGERCARTVECAEGLSCQHNFAVESVCWVGTLGANVALTVATDGASRAVLGAAAGATAVSSAANSMVCAKSDFKFPGKEGFFCKSVIQNGNCKPAPTCCFNNQCLWVCGKTCEDKVNIDR
eukprot:TRINITY_DN18184_c0_g1_i1.p1 TRINITY_DN18184_c0_g1~~TRINITY_DN18184_c0_g1_i1.p1  ORF type:complete len:302 (+),score=27.97 TRINITY_DN18184_c0_g1_i1:143-1048(+)